MNSGLTVIDDKVYTIEDYMKLDDGNRYELIGGKLIMVPRARTKHQEIAPRFFRFLDAFVAPNKLGRVLCDADVFLSGKAVPPTVAPDVLFVAKERLSIIQELNVQGAPDLVIEVLSPSTAAHDRITKSQLYYENGVKEYWIVDPDGEVVEVFVTGEKNWTWMGVFGREHVLATALLPGLEIILKDVFV